MNQHQHRVSPQFWSWLRHLLDGHEKIQANLTEEGLRYEIDEKSGEKASETHVSEPAKKGGDSGGEMN